MFPTPSLLSFVSFCRRFGIGSGLLAPGLGCRRDLSGRPHLGGSASSAKPGFKMKAEAAGAGPALALPFFGPVGRGGWVAVALRASDEALQGD